MKAVTITRDGRMVAQGVVFPVGSTVLYNLDQRPSQSVKVYGTLADINLDYRGCEITVVPITKPGSTVHLPVR